MNNQAKELKTRASYAAPVCEEVPVWIEGPLCGSNEKVEDEDGEW